MLKTSQQKCFMLIIKERNWESMLQKRKGQAFHQDYFTRLFLCHKPVPSKQQHVINKSTCFPFITERAHISKCGDFSSARFCETQ